MRRQNSSLSEIHWCILILYLALHTGGCQEPRTQGAMGEPHSNANVVTVYPDTTPFCAGCSIKLEQFAVLGSDTDSVLLRKLPNVARNSRGSFFAFVSHADDHEIIEYDSAGNYVRAIGRHGAGPGEFRRVSGIGIGPGDTLFVSHDGRYLSLFDRDGRFVRSVSVPTGFRGSLVVLDDRSIMATGWIANPESAGPLLHQITPLGVYRRGIVTASLVDRAGAGAERTHGYAHGGAVWVAEPNNYRLELVDTSGATLRVIGITPPASWATRLVIDSIDARELRAGKFVDGTGAVLARPDRLPFPPAFEVASVYTNDNQHLWVTLHVAVSDWDELEVQYDDNTSEVVQSDEFKQRQYRTAIDVIDVATGRLLARKYLPGYATIANDGTVIVPKYAADGLVRVDAVHATFTQR